MSGTVPAQDVGAWPSHPGEDGHPPPAWTYFHDVSDGTPVAYYPGRVESAEPIDVGPSVGTGALVRQARPTISNATLTSVDINQGSIQGTSLVEAIGFRVQLWDQTRVMGALGFESVNSLCDFLIEGTGIRFPGSGWVYSSSGGSIVIRRRAGNGPVQIENSAGNVRSNIVTEDGAAFTGNVSLDATTNDIGLPGQTPPLAFRGANGRVYARTYSQMVRDGNQTNYDGVWVVEVANGSAGVAIAAYAVGSTSPPTWFVQGECSAQVLTQRSARKDKIHVAVAGELGDVWDQLRPVRYFWRGLRERTDNRRKFGFVADDMPAELTTLDGEGYDVAQLLAVTVARVKQLEAKMTRRPRWGFPGLGRRWAAFRRRGVAEGAK